MMDQEKYKKILLDKFFQKNLSNDERHELEKLALDDPFLFEALQGFTEVEGDHHSDLKRIRSKKLEVKDRRKRSLIPYGIAASLLLLVAVSVWLLGPSSNLATDKTFAEAESTKPYNVKTKKESVPVNPQVAELDMEESIAETTEQAKTYSENSKAENGAGVSEQTTIYVKDQAVKQTDYASSQIERVLNNNTDDLAAAPSPESAFPSTNATSNSSEAEAPMKEKEFAQADEILANQAEIVVEAKDLEKNKKLESAKARNAERSDVPVGGAFIDGIAVNQNFESNFNALLYTEFSSKEIRKLKKNVVIEFDVVDSAIANFKTIPSQDNEINVRLLELVKQNMSYLPENVQDYKIDLTSL